MKTTLESIALLCSGLSYFHKILYEDANSKSNDGQM